MGSPLSAYAKRFVGATGEPGIKGNSGNDGGDGFAQLTPVTKTSDYTVVTSDMGTSLIQMNIAGANNVTIPAASTSFSPSIGDYTFVSQYGAGLTTIVADGGVTIRAVDGILTLPSRYAILMLINIAEDEWLLSNWSNANLTGDVTSVGSTTTLAPITVSTISNASFPYTLLVTDKKKFLLLNRTGGASTIVIPKNTFAKGDQILLENTGASIITITAATGGAIRSADSLVAFYAQYACASLICVDATTDANVWSLSGNLA
jgi:hypothetical protein